MDVQVAIDASTSLGRQLTEEHGWMTHKEQDNSDNDSEQDPESDQLDPDSSKTERTTPSNNSNNTASPTDAVQDFSKRMILTNPKQAVTVPISPAGTSSTIAAQETQPIYDHADLSVPPETPRPFPLSPPRPSQILQEPIYSASPLTTSDSDPEDSLPTVEELAAKMRPSYGSQPDQIRGGTSRSITMSVVDGFDIKMDVDQALPSLVSTPIKCQPTDSPPVSRCSRRKNKQGYTVVETTERTYIDLVSSPSPSEDEGSPPPRNNVKPAYTSQSSEKTQPRPTPKPKRKRTHSGVSRSTAVIVNCAPRPGPSSSSVIAPASLSTAAPRSPPRKRPRMSYRKHPTHWHLDGNTLVQIEKVRFRLQRSLLIRHSDWFRHTFDQGEDAAELEDGVYYIDRIGVDLKDFEVLLDALDDAIKYVNHRPPFHIMASIMRASSALSFNAFEEWAIQYLQSMWSPDLADLSAEPLPFAPESIALARYSDILGVRKRAMYELVRLKEFGQNDVQEQERGRELSQADMKALVRAREHLTSAWFSATASPSKEFQECAGERVPVDGTGGAAGPNLVAAAGPSCTATNNSLMIQAHAKLVHASGISHQYQLDPVNGLQALMVAPWRQAGFCVACVERMTAAWRKKREGLWDNLDVWFGV